MSRGYRKKYGWLKEQIPVDVGRHGWRGQVGGFCDTGGKSPVQLSNESPEEDGDSQVEAVPSEASPLPVR